MTDTSPVNSRSDTAAVRAEMLARATPVRPASPVRQRFQVGGDAPQSDKTADRSVGFDVDADGQGGARQGMAGGFGGALGSGLLGAFTSFLARFVGQGGEQAASLSAQDQARRAGVDAYARAGALVDPQGMDAAQVFQPGLPRLSSGRALDLSV